MEPTWVSECGTVKLWCADCREVLPVIGHVDAVVTDPPYGIDGGEGGDSQKYRKGFYEASFNDDEEYIRAVVVPAVETMCKWDVPMGMTTGTRWIHLYPPACEMGCFWTPAACTHGRWGFTTFQPILYYGKDWRQGKCALPSGRVLTESSEPNGHPCPKPIRAWTWLVDKVAPEAGRVLDPFMGSGTTGVAAVRLGRKFLGIEKEPKYFEIAKRRIQEALNSQPLFKEETKEHQSSLWT